MIYKVIPKEEFRKFVSGLISDNQTFGPRLVDRSMQGDPIYQFREVHSFDEIALDYTRSNTSIKNFFLPFRETLSEFQFSDTDWAQAIEYRVNPRVIVGARACDINALVILDRILIRSNFPSAYYQTRRKNTFLIGMDHLALKDCFCKSLGQHLPLRGYNMFCSDLGDRYFLEIKSSKAFQFLSNVKTYDPTEEDRNQLVERRKLIESSFKTHLELSGLPTLMDISFQSPVWKKWGQKCLNCGSCAMVCPTCYCYGVEETISPCMKSCKKERMQYSCNLVDFAEVAGGHNFRPNREDRLKYRYYHHYRGFSENQGEHICVGCNRCGKACLAEITPERVIRDLQNGGATS